MISYQMGPFRSLIDIFSPLDEFVEKAKTARQACQAVGFRIMGGSGPVPNRLPHDFGVNFDNGGNESRRIYLSK